MQTERRHTPYPFTWEIPAGIVATATGVARPGMLTAHLAALDSMRHVATSTVMPRPSALSAASSIVHTCVLGAGAGLKSAVNDRSGASAPSLGSRSMSTPIAVASASEAAATTTMLSA